MAIGKENLKEESYYEQPPIDNNYYIPAFGYIPPVGDSKYYGTDSDGNAGYYPIPTGSDGESDESKRLIVNVNSSIDIPKYKIVTTNNQGKLGIADNTNLNDINSVLGMTIEDINSGESGKVLREGLFVTTATLIPKLPIFLSNQGNITQTPQTSGFSIIIGYATNVNTIYINIQKPILL